eukprot:TRINITY_DN486_c0_g1_i2.p1 TRINITY_DN486_c0_g1~~TRINITY_DN486_c0_g1_i2.p1  ORF type:complete len:203 (+),score=13.74 TRINITY_DN486_c0_g1_i2:154-762(+)
MWTVLCFADRGNQSYCTVRVCVRIMHQHVERRHGEGRAFFGDTEAPPTDAPATPAPPVTPCYGITCEVGTRCEVDVASGSPSCIDMPLCPNITCGVNETCGLVAVGKEQLCILKKDSCEGTGLGTGYASRRMTLAMTGSQVRANAHRGSSASASPLLLGSRTTATQTSSTTLARMSCAPAICGAGRKAWATRCAPFPTLVGT